MADLGNTCFRGRRRLLGIAAALLALGGCGFRPIYGDQGGAGPRRGLAAITVDIIPERAGQQLREALQERFERFGAGVARRYELRTTFAVSDDPIAI